uniref:Uncharacterized protein n=1 Tax=Lactuca sativa TaxID=4236 RepID=A0A9R1UZW4_LACSA|nr:hypothetical protein LSAT_V11C700361550 [Lactuca sativa]
MGGSRYTYCCRTDVKMSKLDRFQVCKNFMEIFPNVSAIALPRELSDHCPITLRTADVDFGKAPFRFFNSWMKREGCEHIIRETWEKFRGYGTPDAYLAAKLRVKELKELKERTHKLEIEAENRILSSDEINERTLGFQRIAELEKLRLLDLKQRSKIRWVIDGDKNSPFFHGYVNNRRCKNRIHGLIIDGSWTTEADAIKLEAFNFFQGNSRSGGHQGQKLLVTLSPSASSEIEEPFTADEVKRVVWAWDGDKTPGPDGFTFGFIKKYWGILHEDIINYVKHFERYGRLERGCNSAFITLIPKIKDPSHLRDYRPISLIGCLYKII